MHVTVILLLVTNCLYVLRDFLGFFKLKLVVIARHHAMRTERDIAMATTFVCLSVCPSNAGSRYGV